MPNTDDELIAAARRAMIENGFAPDFEASALAEADHASDSLPRAEDARDLRGLLWSSIDNDESRDLDQIEVAESLGGNRTRLLVGIADVDSRAPNDSAIDRHARQNTTSVYAGTLVFPMLPERLSTDLTSLLQDVDRLAVVVEMVIDGDGAVEDAKVYRAAVRNRAKLAYDGVSAWLEGRGDGPRVLATNGDLAKQVRLQYEIGQRLKTRRQERGALEFETIEARPVIRDGRIVDLRVPRKGPAREMIEDFMIASNGAMARYLEACGVASIRRVVKSPERWQRIVALAQTHGEVLPAEADSLALAGFLSRMRAKDPDHFVDLSLSVVKLMGPGEYTVDLPGQPDPPGHFGLAVQDYTHSTAPNRRYADLVTQRLVKASLAKTAPPYDAEQLETFAGRCTQKENDARKVERRVRKTAAALMLSDRIGETFDGIVTGANASGTFVRLLAPPAEGRVVRGEAGMDVGDRVHVRLLSTDAEKGFIDFARA